MQELETLLNKREFPRCARYDHDFMLDHQMGPNALWLLEWLCEELELEAGMRVLDLGCGRGMTSIFLAREYGVRVWAGDLWIHPEKNWQRMLAHDVADLVCPMHLEAHKLPFAPGFFDAIVSIDAYQYFGTDVLYLGYLSRFLRPGGAVGVVVPGLTQELPDPLPPHLTAAQNNGKVFWEEGCWSFQTAECWRTLWQRSEKVEAVETSVLPQGWRHWADFERALELTGKGIFPSDVEALEADAGRYIGFVKLAARRNARPAGFDFYDPALGARAGVD